MEMEKEEAKSTERVEERIKVSSLEVVDEVRTSQQ